MREFISQPWFAYVMLGIVVLSFVIVRVVPFIKRLFRKNEGFYFNEESNISHEQYRKLALGAVYSEQQSAYINSLTTGMDNDDIKTITSEWWGIDSSREAHDMLTYLAEKGFRYTFPYVYKAFMTDSKEKQELIILSGLTDEQDTEKAFSQLENLNETFGELCSDNVVETVEDVNRYGVVGWDCGRLVFLARICYDAKYITETEAWQYIETADVLSRQTINSWDDFAKSYVIGRAMWGGKGSDNSDIASIADSLLTDSDSPWVQLRW